MTFYGILIVMEERMTKQKMVKKTFYFPMDLFEKLKDYSGQINRTMSDINRTALTIYLNDVNYLKSESTIKQFNKDK